jgi:hypothetical protein
MAVTGKYLEAVLRDSEVILSAKTAIDMSKLI